GCGALECEMERQVIGHRVDQRGLVPDARVERHRRHAEAIGDVAHAHRVEAAFPQHGDGGGDDRVVVELELARAGHPSDPSTSASALSSNWSACLPKYSWTGFF